MEIKLNSRQMKLRDLAEENEYAFYPMTTRNMKKYKDFPIENGARISYEENTLSKYTDYGKLEISDITLTEGARTAQEDTKITVLHVSDLDVIIPDFALEPEGLFTKFSELTFGKDIDFKDHPDFSKKYYLRSNNETATREFFNESILAFLESHDEMHIESHRNKLLIYKKRGLLEREEIAEMILFTSAFTDFLLERVTQNA
jgi:hypothetical protein